MIGTIAMTLASVSAFGAGAPNTGAAVTTASPATKLETIAPADIPERADLDERFVRSALGRAKAADGPSRFARQLDVQAIQVQRLLERTHEEDLAILPARRLETVRRHWQLLARALRDWQIDLQRATKASSDDAAGISDRHAVWAATQTELTHAAPALQQRATDVMTELDSAGPQVAELLGDFLNVSRRGSNLSVQVQASLASVTARIEEEDRRLTALDSPPFWQVSDHADTAVPKNIGGSLRNLFVETAFAADYDASRAKPLRVLITGCILLLPALLWLRRRSDRLVTTGLTSRASVQALSRPWAAWFVLAAAALVLYDVRGPVLRQQIVLLLAWIPVLRLLPSRMMKAIGFWAHFSAAFYCLNLLASLLVGNNVTYRMALLAIDLLMAATAIALWLRSRNPYTTPDSERQGKVTSPMFLVIAALSLAGALSNLIGNVSLAEMLTAATLDSSYVALAICAGAVVLTALVRVLLAGLAVSRFATIQVESLIQVCSLVGRALLIGAWVVFALQSLRIYRPLLDVLRSILSRESTVGTVTLSLGSCVAFVVSAWLAFWLAKTIRLLLGKDVLPALSLPLGVGESISTLSYYTVIFLGLLTALALAGFDVGQMAIVFGALGVGIGFGLQDVVKNFVSGLILMFERPVRLGDVVDVAGTSGTVRGIGMRATTITTFEGADVVVPNGMVLADKLINWTLRGNRRRIDVDVSTGYDASPRKTIELLTETARSLDGIAPTPEPVAILTGLSRGALEFNVRAWTTDRPDWLILRSNLALSVGKALSEAGIEVPKPQSDVYFKRLPDEVLEVLASLRPADKA